MIILQEEKISQPSPCHYIPGQFWRFRYFFAVNLNAIELESFLSTGWRKFGYYFFKPDCDSCSQCSPLRVKAQQFKPSKSQKRILKKNAGIHVRFEPLEYTDEIFKLYQKHSLNRFGKEETDAEEFAANFFTESCPSCLSVYYSKESLTRVGFLDISNSALSSVYFVYDTDYSTLNPGTFSILYEINHAASLGLNDYYLGYYIESCNRMAYKGTFRPYEVYDWQTKCWNHPTACQP